MTWHPSSLAVKSVVGRLIRKRLMLAAIAVVFVWIPAHAQQSSERVYRIGFLRGIACADPPLFTALRQGLRDRGYTEGRNLIIECRAAPDKGERVADLAAELARKSVDILVSEGTRSSLAAKEATRTIPIVMVYTADPVASGLVASLARPGGNLTGLSTNLTETVWKNLEILKQVAPGISRIAMLMDSANPGQRLLAERLDAAARAMGVRIQRIDILTPAALPDAFAAVLRHRAEALIVYPILTIGPSDVRKIVEFAVENRLPTMTFHTPYVEAGLLMHYGPNIPDQYRRAGGYIDKILKGAKPADLPVEEPTTYELVINQRTARALRLRIPELLLQRADRVIE